MNSRDKFTLSWMTILTVVSVLLVINHVHATLEIALKVVFGNFELSMILSVVSVLASMAVMSLLYQGQVDSSRTTVFYLFSSPEEEIIFRFNSVLASSFLVETQQILFVAIVQAFFFAILHPKNFIKFFILALVWFATTYWGGILPAMLGHIAANLTHRYKARKEHGWYDEE